MLNRCPTSVHKYARRIYIFLIFFLSVSFQQNNKWHADGECPLSARAPGNQKIQSNICSWHSVCFKSLKYLLVEKKKILLILVFTYQGNIKAQWKSLVLVLCLFVVCTFGIRVSLSITRSPQTYCVVQDSPKSAGNPSSSASGIADLGCHTELVLPLLHRRGVFPDSLVHKDHLD